MPDKILNLTLKKKWFDMILSGQKPEEYREIKDYWARRFLYSSDEIEWQAWQEMLHDMRSPFDRHLGPAELVYYFGVKFKSFDIVRFRNGYATDSPTFDVYCKGIQIKNGREEWGAEIDKFYFSIQLGEIINA